MGQVSVGSCVKEELARIVGDRSRDCVGRVCDEVVILSTRSSHSSSLAPGGSQLGTFFF